LVELAAVLAILALLAGAAFTRFGTSTLENLGAESCARKFALDLVLARRRTIATGDNHYLQLTMVASKVTEYSVVRRSAGGDVAVDSIRQVPVGVSVTARHGTLEFNFDGGALAAYSVNVAGPQRTWAISTVMTTGAVTTKETTL
jgi:hypothetical protein